MILFAATEVAINPVDSPVLPSDVPAKTAEPSKPTQTTTVQLPIPPKNPYLFRDLQRTISEEWIVV